MEPLGWAGVTAWLAGIWPGAMMAVCCWGTMARRDWRAEIIYQYYTYSNNYYVLTQTIRLVHTVLNIKSRLIVKDEFRL